VHFVGWVLIALGLLGAFGLASDIVRKGLEEDRVGGILVGLLVAAAGVGLVVLV
jgi:hypothetical protein